MSAQHSNDLEASTPMSLQDWDRHIAAVLVDPDAHCRLLAAPARRPFAGVRRHTIADESETTGGDADQRGIAAPEGQA